MVVKKAASGQIKNPFGEKIDFVVEGNPTAYVTVVFVHGFGTNRDEGFNLFVDLKESLLENYRVVRFDFSGYGKSEGRQEDADLLKHAKDLKAVLDYTRSVYDGEIYILAFSMGCFVVSILDPEDVKKTIFVSPPSSDPKTSIESLKRRILSKKGGAVNEDEISIYPRTGGQVQKVGPSHWRVLRGFDPIAAITQYSKRTELVVIRPLEDDVFVGDVTRQYQKVSSLKYVEVHGDHGFTKNSDRRVLIQEIGKYF